MTKRVLLALLLATSGAVLLADEGMWRVDQVPFREIEQKYGVRLTAADLERVQSAVVRISSGGTGTFASSNGLILTNHHVALDCIRTSTLAEQGQGKADNLIEQGFTAATLADELSCKRFRVQVERSARDVTVEINAGVKPGMSVADVQRARQMARSDLERACQQEKGPNFTCQVNDFNSGAQSLLMVYEEWKDIRLVYAPEKQLGYFGGDEMNFRFPRYVSDISILRAYVGTDGSHGEYDSAHVPYRPSHYLPVTLDGVKDGDFALVAGHPGATYRYRESYSAAYNVEKGIPEQIADLKANLDLLRKYASMKPEYQVILQSQIFGFANSLKYSEDLLAALKATNVVEGRRQREREFTEFLAKNPAQAATYGGALEAQRVVYANDVATNAALDNALGWLQRASTVGYAVGLYEFSLERAKSSDRDREPQFQERRWPDVRQALLDDEPRIADLEVDILTKGFEKALALPADQRIPAVTRLAERLGANTTPRAMAETVIKGSSLASVDARKALIDASPDALAASTDPAAMFARDLLPSLKDQRQRVRVLNEKLLQNRSLFVKGLSEWKGKGLYPDANFTLRVTYGRAAGYTDTKGTAVPFTTRFGDMFTLAQSRGNSGEFALPGKLEAWRRSLDDAAFRQRYAPLPVNFVTTNDITGGNSGSATLNRNLQIVGLIFDGNEEAMAGDWVYSDTRGRALSTDIRFALTVAREVHGAGRIVEELLNPGASLGAR